MNWHSLITTRINPHTHTHTSTIRPYYISLTPNLGTISKNTGMNSPSKLNTKLVKLSDSCLDTSVKDGFLTRTSIVPDGFFPVFLPTGAEPELSAILHLQSNPPSSKQPIQPPSPELQKPLSPKNWCTCQRRCGSNKYPCKKRGVLCGSKCHRMRKGCVNIPHSKSEVPAIDLTGEETKGEANESYSVIIEDKRLRKEDRAILDSRSHKWLNDNHIAAAQLQLQRQHPRTLGLEPPVLQFTQTFSVHKGKLFIQIINVSGNHWITMSTLVCLPRTTKVYDSLNLSLTTSLKRLVADLMLRGGKKITIQHVHVQFQTGTSDR